MSVAANGFVGFVCSYTPLALMHAAGLIPFRVLPLTEAADGAGSLLHESMCPHVKRVLDRAVAGDLPPLEGMVIMSSCDAMRRLADAWALTRPQDELAVVELPVSVDESALEFFTGELRDLRERFEEWTGAPVTDDAILASGSAYDRLTSSLAQLEERARRGTLHGGWSMVQEMRNRAVTEPLEQSHTAILSALAEAECKPDPRSGVPILLSGNVLPDPEAFELFASCGARLVADDLCTGSRQLLPLQLDAASDPIPALARALLGRPACARTMTPGVPGGFGEQVLASAQACDARGLILHVMKFCDPYLARLPAVRERLRAAGLPVLVLEGDCSLRSLGQHKTRISAFVEMLEDGC